MHEAADLTTSARLQTTNIRPAFKEVTVGGLRTIVATRRELAQLMVEDCLAARSDPSSAPQLVFSSNGEGIALTGRSAKFAQLMEEADLIHADGMSVVFASG